MTTALSLEGLPVVFVFFAGRAGGGFLQSLLDGHDQILMVPTELQFHRAWSRLGCRHGLEPAAMADLWCTRSKLVRFRTGIHYGVEDATNAFTPCDPDVLRAHLVSQLERYGTARRGTFLAIHHAYALAVGQAIEPLRLLVEMPAYPQWAADALTDFPDARVIQVVRDHRANYASYLSQLAPVPLLQDLRESLLILNRLRGSLGAERFLTIRLEDLHLDHERTVERLAAWLHIDDRPSLRQSTLGGVPWLGNSSTGTPVRGVSPEVVTRWRTRLSRREVRVVEAVVGADLERHGYAADEPARPLLARLWSALAPLPGEFSGGVPDGPPGNRVLRAAWRVHPRAAQWLRLARQVPRFAAARVSLARLITRAGDFGLDDRERAVLVEQPAPPAARASRSL